MVQNKLVENQKDDDFVNSLELTQEKIKQDMERMKTLEGFPEGDEEDILELSNPPYFTAYPNAYIGKFIKKFGERYDPETDNYHREPFVGDVSEGKNDPIYMVHTYHTKVPHKAIMPFIEHYTNSGDIILDGFCGSGMTGIASSLLNRKAILIDLGPAATFIASNLNVNSDPYRFNEIFTRIERELKCELGWLYETKHIDGSTGKIHYTIWSDVFVCPNCNNEIVFWDIAIDKKTNTVMDHIFCNHCSIEVSKSNLQRSFSKNEEGLFAKQVPVIIEYIAHNKRFRKKPDTLDLKLLQRIEESNIPYWYPKNRMPDGDESRRNDKIGITHVHHFYTKRNQWALSLFYNKIINVDVDKFTRNSLLFYFTSILPRSSKLFKWSSNQAGPMTGTLYISSANFEISLFSLLTNKRRSINNSLSFLPNNNTICSTQSTTDLSNIPENSIDYIFTDPPFGENLMYSELNFLMEVWLKVYTNNEDETIINSFQNKQLGEYQNLMTKCFKEYCRVLKPNRWITVEFHNSKAEVWRVIQEAIVKAGFIIGQVAVLDKKQGTFKQVNLAGAVKNDLVINAYKPSDEFRTSFLKKAGLNLERDFINMHLDKLPVEPNVERTQQMLYSKLLAQYIQNSFEVRIDASEFYGLLRNNFTERDGLWFNRDQIPEYEKRVKLKKNIGKFNLAQTVLGVDNEKTAIIWLAQFLRTPKSYSEISIDYNKNLLTSSDKMPELKSMLEENFVTENGKFRLPSMAEKREKEDIRDRRLSREFQEMLQEANAGKKIVYVRKEALLHGLIELYNKKAVDQIKVIGKRVDSKILESDDEIYAIIDWAMSKDD